MGGNAIRPSDVASAQALFRRGEYALAIETYRQLLRTQPDNADVYNGLAVSYAALGRHDLSNRFFELALSLDPASTKVRRNYALSLERQGRMEDANVLLGQIGSTPRVSLAQIAERSVSAEGEAQKMAAPGPHLSRQSDGEVRLATALPEKSVALGIWANSITVKIIDRPAADKTDKQAAPDKTAPETPVAETAGEGEKLSINAAGRRDRAFARLWTRIRTLEAGG